MRPVEWVGRSLSDLRELPDESRRVFGYALYRAQLGERHPAAKLLKGEFGGLVEVVDDHDGNTYRAVYTAKLGSVIYVLHVFQKKSTHGIATPRRELAVIRNRWQRARAHHAANQSSGGD